MPGNVGGGVKIVPLRRLSGSGGLILEGRLTFGADLAKSESCRGWVERWARIEAE
jgi:hypothetical protein